MDKHELVSLVKKLANESGNIPTREDLWAGGASDYSIRKNGGLIGILKLAGLEIEEARNGKFKPIHHLAPKILLFDIETAPILAYVWKIWDENIALNQIVKDWHVLSWSAKWLDSKEVMYADQSKEKNIEDDTRILKEIHKLLDEADIVITQNGVKFDNKKLNARFIKAKLPKPSSFRHIDTLKIARKHFAITSNKLEFLAEFLEVKVKKSKHKKFPGFLLWRACLDRVQAAWEEMEKYNKADVLALEGVYYKLRTYEPSINFNVFHDFFENYCQCGSDDFQEKGFEYTNKGVFQRYQCNDCKTHYTDKNNLLSPKKKSALKRLS